MLNLELTRSDGFVLAAEQNLAQMEREVIKSIVLNDIPDVLEKERRKGFNTDPDAYTLIMRNRGRETKRQLRTLPGSIPYMSISRPRQPLSFTFVQKGAQNWQEVLRALEDGMYMVESRYSRIRDSGFYGQNLMFFAREGSVYVLTRRLSQADIDELQEGDVIGIVPMVSYASWVEAYHGASKRRWNEKGKRRYGTSQTFKIGGGIVRPIAMALARKYPNIAVRFQYSSHREHMQLRAASEFGGSGIYEVPMIVLAPKGTFANSFVPIGRKNLRRR